MKRTPANMNEFVLPDYIPADMGGDGEKLDVRMRDVLRLLEYAPISSCREVLDIGIGKGQVAQWFAKKGMKVIGTGIAIESYGMDRATLDRFNIDIVECDVEKMPFEDDRFDCVVMSHVLEHCRNVGAALGEVRRVLKQNGVLLIFVPPADDLVCAGHVSVGWNIGQLMYVLLLNGFRITDGLFAEFNYNVCGFVRKDELALPPIRMDRGDIAIMKERFPVELWRYSNGGCDGYFARLTAVNFSSEYFERFPADSRSERLVQALCRLVPRSALRYLSRKVVRLGRILGAIGYRP